MKYSIITINLFLFVLSILAFCFAQDSDMPHGDDFKLDCELCHSTVDWNVSLKETEFKHEDTGFPLLGEHVFVNCRDCHKNLIFNRIGHACVDCHTDVHAGKLGIQCERCHTPVNWDNHLDIFKIHENNLFPLTGVHAILNCQDCHTTETYNEFINTKVDCKSCHLTDYIRTLNPAHQKSGFNLNCENCHLPNLATWENVVYAHTDAFPLIGGHANLECEACHKETYNNTPNTCSACHQTDYNSAVDPNHVTFGFPTFCEQCHNINSWSGTVFDHFVESGFALIGRHNTIQCIDCHIDNQLTGLSRDCFGCHSTDFTSASDPNHQQGGFSHNCLDCHNKNAWSPAEFDHNQTDFPLTGTHVSVTCTDCHIGGQYSGLSTDCYSCHEQDYQSVDDPNHVTNNFNKNCTICHNTSAWEPAEFDHTQTDFPLTGAHATIICADCHVGSQYTGLSTDCYSCHEQDYQGVDDPNHITNSFDKNCTICHNNNSWEPAEFDHTQTGFPLDGAHANQTCIDCHSAGYTNTPTECISCHGQDYNNTSDPSHSAAQFPTECQNCHSTSNWESVQWDHDGQYFPIYSGRHRGEWDVCNDCHVNEANYTQFECITCHEHSNKNEVDNDHNEVNNYIYQSTACYDCHPNGRGDD